MSLPASKLLDLNLQTRVSYLPKLGCVDDLVLVQRLGHIISRVELGSADSGGRSSCDLLVRGEGASILSLDGPQSPLVVGLGPAVTAHAPDEILVPACSRWLRHRCCLESCTCLCCARATNHRCSYGDEKNEPEGLSCLVLRPKP